MAKHAPRAHLLLALAAAAALAACARPAAAGQAPLAASAADVPISSRDRVYATCQTSNTLSVIDPAAGKLLGVITLGGILPATLGATYIANSLVHGIGYSPDGKTVVAVAVASNSVIFIDTATNRVKATTYVGRAPHEAFYNKAGTEVWVSIRGEDFIQVLSATTYQTIAKITVPKAPGMVIFSPDGRYAYVSSSGNFTGGSPTPDAVVIDAVSRAIVGRIPQASPFSPNIAATPDGKQVWFTLKDSGRVQVISATPPFKTIAVLATGPITNHVNFAVTGDGRQLAYISVAGAAAVQVWTTDSRPARVATVEEVGFNPHGVWPSGDGRRVYVALQGGNAIAVIDTSTNTLAATIPAGGQGPMALAYVPNAIPAGAPPAVNLSAPGVASGNNSLYLVLAPPGAKKGDPLVTRVTLNRQGFIDQLEATVAGIKTGGTYVLALSPDRAGTAGELQPIAQFSGNADGAANPATVGTFRFALGAGGAGAGAAAGRRYLVVAEFAGGQVGRVLQVQQE